MLHHCRNKWTCGGVNRQISKKLNGLQSGGDKKNVMKTMWEV